jgi:riboflavin synthase
MFAGIIEELSPVLDAHVGDSILRINVKKPNSFRGLVLGESIAVNGVCLTLEKESHEALTFCLGPETLKITGWTASSVLERAVNLERSLRMGDRIHGHLVTGHVDAIAKVIELRLEGETLWLKLQVPESCVPFIWPKGSVALNGVSLTVNQVEGDSFTVGLIPETLKRTNLRDCQIGAELNLEVDNLARGMVHMVRNQSRPSSYFSR